MAHFREDYAHYLANLDEESSSNPSSSPPSMFSPTSQDSKLFMRSNKDVSGAGSEPLPITSINSPSTTTQVNPKSRQGSMDDPEQVSLDKKSLPSFPLEEDTNPEDLAQEGVLSKASSADDVLGSKRSRRDSKRLSRQGSVTKMDKYFHRRISNLALNVHAATRQHQGVPTSSTLDYEESEDLSIVMHDVKRKLEALERSQAEFQERMLAMVGSLMKEQ